MEIVLISPNYYPEKVGIGKYNYEFCSYLAKSGHKVNVITSFPYYPDWKVDDSYAGINKKVEYIENVKVVRCKIYVPNKPTIVKRIYHLASFSLSIFRSSLIEIRKRPDYVIMVQPTLFAAPFILTLCKFYSVKSVMHVQDFEFDAMLGLNPDKKLYLGKFFSYVERKITQSFYRVSTISNKMLEKLSDKGVDRNNVILFPNWSDINFIKPHMGRDFFLKECGIPLSHKVVLYSGNMGDKQGLENVIEAASFFELDDVHFVLVGEGSSKETLIYLAKERELKNVSFLDLQQWSDVPNMLCSADLHLVIQKKGAADAVLPSKLTNILACGGWSVVTAEEDTELGIISKMYPGIFTLCQPENISALVNSIKNTLSKSISSYNEVARKYAVTNLDKNSVIEDFMAKLELLSNNKNFKS